MADADDLIDIDLTAREEIDRLYKSYGNGDSAHAFQSLFIWKEDMGLMLFKEREMYAVRCRREGNNTWFFPVGPDDAKEAFISKVLKAGEICFTYMTAADVTFLENHFAGRFEIKSAPDDSEYIIDRTDMELMQGKHFAKDRNHVSKLLREHKLKTVPVTADNTESDNIAAVREINSDWASLSHDYSRMSDSEAVKCILDNINALDISGVILYMDGRPWAAAAGYRLSEDTVDCCLQKTRDNVQGLSYYLRQEFARSFDPEIKWFNWEEDLGITGLRRTKQLMKPCRMNDMYTAYML